MLLFTILTSSNCTLTSFNVSRNRLEDRVLRACPREHRAVVLHAISPISVKLCHHPPGFSRFSPRKSLQKQVKCMKLSLRWYLINYSEDFHTYFSILSQCPPQVLVNLINGLSINRSKETTVFFRLFDSFKYLTTLRSNISPCQKATTLILIPLYNPSFHL